jgi:hypothetical protein
LIYSKAWATDRSKLFTLGDSMLAGAYGAVRTTVSVLLWPIAGRGLVMVTLLVAAAALVCTVAFWVTVN